MAAAAAAAAAAVVPDLGGCRQRATIPIQDCHLVGQQLLVRLAYRQSMAVEELAPQHQPLVLQQMYGEDSYREMQRRYPYEIRKQVRDLVKELG